MQTQDRPGQRWSLCLLWGTVRTGLTGQALQELYGQHLAELDKMPSVTGKLPVKESSNSVGYCVREERVDSG